MKEEIPIHEMPIVYRVPGMDAVRVQSHFIRKQPEDTELILDQYLPSGRAASAPAPGVLLVHGGPLHPDSRPLPKDWRAFASYGRLLAASGLTGLMFNHRYYGKKGEQQAGEDIEAVFAYIHTQAGKMGLDADRLGVWVFSGAGKLLPGILRRQESIKSLVLYYALLEFNREDALWPSVFKKIPLGVARAGLDRAKINKNLDELAKRARAAQVSLELWQHAAGHHGFDILDDDEQSREIIAQTIAFLRRHTCKG